MNKKPVDKTKKSNIKCEHCKYFNRNKSAIMLVLNHIESHSVCDIKNEPKYYWNRCENFEWADKYKGE